MTGKSHQDGQGFELGIRVSWRVRSIGGIQVQKTNDLKDQLAGIGWLDAEMGMVGCGDGDGGDMFFVDIEGR